MAETATDSGKTLGVSKHTWEIIGIAVAGGAVLYFGYRWYSNRSSAKTTGSLSGTVTPLAVTGAVGTTGATPTSSGPLTTMDAWINSIISSTSKLTPAVLFNAVNAWQNGTPVTATAYAAISKALRNGIPSWAKGYKLYVTKTTTGSSGGTTTTTGSSGGATTPAPTTTPSKNTTIAAILGKTINVATLGGKEFYVLGSGLGPTFRGWNVGTGAPVFFTWKGNGTPRQGPPPPGATTVTVYTPTSTPISLITHHTHGTTVAF